jgi:tRNA 2-thiouridine synthesizing protein E
MEQLLRQPEFDEFGLLTPPRDWSPELARELARDAGIDELTDQHWAFINSLQAYYREFHVPPPPSKICHKLQLQHGCGHELFHTCLTAWRIAGLPDPGEEAKAYLSAE